MPVRNKRCRNALWGCDGLVARRRGSDMTSRRERGRARTRIDDARFQPDARFVIRAFGECAATQYNALFAGLKNDRRRVNGNRDDRANPYPFIQEAFTAPAAMAKALAVGRDRSRFDLARHELWASGS